MEDQMLKEKEIHLRDYLNIVKKRKFIVFSFFIITFTVIFINTMTATPIYVASTSILIEKNESSALMLNYGYMQYDPEFLQTQSQIITSFPVSLKVVKALNLEETYDSYFAGIDGFSIFSVGAVVGKIGNFLSSVAEGVKNILGASSDAAIQDMEEEEISRAEVIAEIVSGGIMVDPIPESKIVTISYMSENPELAAMITNTAVRAYMKQLLEMKMDTSNFNLKWMKEKGAEEAAKLEKSERKLNEYMKSKDIVTIENKVIIIPQKLAELSSELTMAESRQKELSTLYEKITTHLGNYEELKTIPVIADDQALKTIQSQILEAEQNFMDLSKKFGPKHPTMVRAESELTILKNKQGQEIRRIIKTIKNEYDLAKSQESNLRHQLEETKKEAVNFDEKFIQYGILKREIETNQILYNALMQKIKEQSITEQAQNISVCVIEEAKTPEFPAKPNKKRNLLLGIVLGLFGGVGLAFFIEYLDNTIKTQDDIETRYSVPVLATISKLKNKDKNLYRMVLDDPSSAHAEHFKSLRTAIMLSASETPPKKILVTSMAPQDGKTTVASNLALALARLEHKVLLVDCDLRRPMVHKVFDLNNSRGLSTFIAGASDKKIVKNLPVENLSVITSGPVPPNPSELLISKRMNELIQVLEEKFDFIIFDTPPVLSVSDTLIISKIVDAGLIVIRSGKTTYEMMDHGLKAMAGVNSKIIGIVINAVDESKSGYNYYQYYSSEQQA